MRRATFSKTLKFAHVAGSTGFCAALLALMVLHGSLPEPSEMEEFVALRITMGNVAKWLLLPSTALVVISGLFSMAFSDVYKNAGWVWIKLASGVLVFEGTLVHVQAPMERAARQGLAALAGEFDAGQLGATLDAEYYALWIILGVAVANIVLAIYQPKFSRARDQ